MDVLNTCSIVDQLFLDNACYKDNILDSYPLRIFFMMQCHLAKIFLKTDSKAIGPKLDGGPLVFLVVVVLVVCRVEGRYRIF